MSAIVALLTAPRCARCAGRGYLPYTTRDGARLRLICGCAARADGAAAEPRTAWPSHLAQGRDWFGVFIDCVRGCRRQYITAPGQHPAVLPPSDQVWSVALAHRCAPTAIRAPRAQEIVR